MSVHKKDVAQPREAAVIQADDLNDLEGVEIVRPTEIPMGIRLASSNTAQADAAQEPSSDPGQAEPADAPPTNPAPAVVQEPSSGSAPADAVQSPPSSPAPAAVAETSSTSAAPATAAKDLTAQFAQQYKTVCKIDDAVAQFEVKKRRTPEYWELGKIS